MIADVEAEAGAAGLFVAGALYPEDGGTLVLLGAGSDFWYVLCKEAEFSGPDPVDRYSERVLTTMAAQFDAVPVFPFGGPPYAPFIQWALQSGRAWQSPVGMLIQETAGLMISYRGALRFKTMFDLPVPGTQPCGSCSDKPCLQACPVDALSRDRGYDVDACHRHLDSKDGADCMTSGCRARRACPVSAAFGRDPEQSAHHMRAFHPCPDF